MAASIHWKKCTVSPRATVGAVTLLLAAAVGSGCSESEPDPTASTPTRSESGPHGEETPTPSTKPASLRDLLAAIPATPPHGSPGPPSLVRANDGTTIVAFEPGWPRERTTYRIYDRHWRPRTPLLRVDVSLHVSRSTATGFIAHASLSRRDGSSALREWVTIDRNGSIRPVSQHPNRSAAAQPLRPGDLHLESSGRTTLAYRTSNNTVLKANSPPWNTVGHTWYDNDEGHICAVRSAPLAEGTIHVSADEGRTFTDIAIADLVPEGSGPRLQACWASGDRILVETGGENPQWLHTLDKASQNVLSSRQLGDLLDPYTFDTLPDGRLVTGTNRAGLMVATDSTNQIMDYRPGPVSPNTFFQIVDNQLISASRGRVNFSTDAGLTWREVDLELP
jgi:hypothetical protein